MTLFLFTIPSRLDGQMSLYLVSVFFCCYLKLFSPFSKFTLTSKKCTCFPSKVTPEWRSWWNILHSMTYNLLLEMILNKLLWPTGVASELNVEVVYQACYETRLNHPPSPPCATTNVHIWVLPEPIHFSLCMANKEDRRWMIKAQIRSLLSQFLMCSNKVR